MRKTGVLCSYWNISMTRCSPHLTHFLILCSFCCISVFLFSSHFCSFSIFLLSFVLILSLGKSGIFLSSHLSCSISIVFPSFCYLLIFLLSFLFRCYLFVHMVSLWLCELSFCILNIFLFSFSLSFFRRRICILQRSKQVRIQRLCILSYFSSHWRKCPFSSCWTYTLSSLSTWLLSWTSNFNHWNIYVHRFIKKFWKLFNGLPCFRGSLGRFDWRDKLNRASLGTEGTSEDEECQRIERAASVKLD